VDTVAKAVNETTSLLAKSELQSGRDLGKAEVAKKFSADLTARLEKAGLKLEAKAVMAAVSASKAG